MATVGVLDLHKLRGKRREYQIAAQANTPTHQPALVPPPYGWYILANVALPATAWVCAAGLASTLDPNPLVWQAAGFAAAGLTFTTTLITTIVQADKWLDCYLDVKRAWVDYLTRADAPAPLPDGAYKHGALWTNDPVDGLAVKKVLKPTERREYEQAVEMATIQGRVILVQQGEKTYLDYTLGLWTMAQAWNAIGKTAEKHWIPKIFSREEYTALRDYLIRNQYAVWVNPRKSRAGWKLRDYTVRWFEELARENHPPTIKTIQIAGEVWP